MTPQKNLIKLAKLDYKVQIHPWQREREGDGREERVEEVVDELAAGVAHLRGRNGGSSLPNLVRVTDITVTHLGTNDNLLRAASLKV